MKTEIYGILGLARRAGKIVSGEAAVEAHLKKKKGRLLIIAEDAPGRSTKYQQWAADLKIDVLQAGEKAELGRALGLSPRAVLLIIDDGFAQLVKNIRS